jgi:hypothetical protein
MKEMRPHSSASSSRCCHWRHLVAVVVSLSVSSLASSRRRLPVVFRGGIRVVGRRRRGASRSHHDPHCSPRCIVIGISVILSASGRGRRHRRRRLVGVSVVIIAVSLWRWHWWQTRGHVWGAAVADDSCVAPLIAIVLILEFSKYQSSGHVLTWFTIHSRFPEEGGQGVGGGSTPT